MHSRAAQRAKPAQEEIVVNRPAQHDNNRLDWAINLYVKYIKKEYQAAHLLRLMDTLAGRQLYQNAFVGLLNSILFFL